MNTFSSHPDSFHLVSSNRSAHRRRFGTILLAVLLSIGVVDGASARNNKTRNTLIGVGIGAAGGALLSNGDAWGTLGGAAAGGLIGNVLTKDHHDRRDRRDRGWDSRRGRDPYGRDRHGYPPRR